MNQNYRYVIEFSQGVYQCYLFVKPEGGSWYICDPGSELARKAIEAGNGNPEWVKKQAERFNETMVVNKDFLDGRTELPEQVKVPPPDERAKAILLHAAMGRIPLGVALDYLEDMKREGLI